MSGVDYIKRIVGKGGDRIILDVEKSALTLVYGKDGKPCEVDCQTKAFEYKQEPTNPAFPTQVEYLEIGDVTHQWFSGTNAPLFGLLNSIHRKASPTAEWIVPEGQYFVMGITV